MRRIAVLGTTGSGKTILARDIAARLGVPCIELDALFWGANWTHVSTAMLRERVDLALRGEAWVSDGNYSKVRDIVWSRADTLVWLDYSLWLILWRLLLRTTRRLVRREELWSGNHESVRQAFFSKNSLFVWALQTYRRHRREYSRLSETEYARLEWIRLRSPREAARWISGIRAVRS